MTPEKQNIDKILEAFCYLKQFTFYPAHVALHAFNLEFETNFQFSLDSDGNVIIEN